MSTAPQPPHLSTITVECLASVICGGSDPEHPMSPYRTYRQINDLFVQDLGLDWAAPCEMSRPAAAKNCIQKYNGTPDLARIIEAAVRPSDYLSESCSLQTTVDYLNKILAPEGLRLAPSGRSHRLVTMADIALPPADTPDVLSSQYVRELADKCDTKLSSGDFDGAITNARTLLEEVLYALEIALTGSRGDYSGDLPKQFKAVAKLLRMDDERPDLDQRFKDVVRGLTMMISGFAPIRNKMSDGHARERKPAPHHARLVVNAAKTVALFLVESYRAQRERGLLPGGTSTDGVA